MKSQVWLDKTYPKKEERCRVNIILITEQLEGELDLKGFTCGRLEVFISYRVDPTQFTIIINQGKSVKIISNS